ncbi:hypothetical protein SAMN04487898_106113 [Pedobacter sp. ok626]|uniref:DUF7336 domain-containing protein n=1 Tax=Pedobacter sp. ok626 TaxID=1761882 RepID=UPI00087EFAC8|nr:hypothetical protein [Pedobacter sp. ok626]SDK12678.1 hypothetical protein SAMN04487898_106113 [Pedobacter sp. ok626]
MEVYLLWHTHIDERLDGGEDVKLIGVYSSIDEANSAMERKRIFEGFKDHKDGFEVSTYTLDSDSWTEGFVTQFS